MSLPYGQYLLMAIPHTMSSHLPYYKELFTLKKKILSPYRCILSLKKKARYRLLMGARGSGKTYNLSLQCLIWALETKVRIVILRKTLESERYSVWNEFKEHIQKAQLSAYVRFVPSRRCMEIISTQSELIFLGLYESAYIKGLSSVDYIWIEEADQINQNDFLNIDLSIRQSEKNIFFLSFNPPESGQYHWIYQQFMMKIWTDLNLECQKNKKSVFIYHKTHSLMLFQSSYHINPFLPKSFRHSLNNLSLDSHHPMSVYQRLALGQWVEDGGNRVYPHKEITQIKEWKEYQWSIGLDFGFINPNALVLVGYHKKCIYIMAEWGKANLLPHDLVQSIQEFYEKHRLKMTIPLYADNARPELIALLRQSGLNIQAVRKGPQSIHRGIDFIRMHRLIVSPDCHQCIDELNTYCFSQSTSLRSPQSLNPLDQNNHYLDALRYALETHISAHQHYRWGRGREANLWESKEILILD